MPRKEDSSLIPLEGSEMSCMYVCMVVVNGTDLKGQFLWSVADFLCDFRKVTQLLWTLVSNKAFLQATFWVILSSSFAGRGKQRCLSLPRRGSHFPHLLLGHTQRCSGASSDGLEGPQGMPKIKLECPFCGMENQGPKKGRNGSGSPSGCNK